MKKLLTLFATAFVSAHCFGQSLPNPGFESWINYTADTPAVNLQRPSEWFGADSVVVVIGRQYGPAFGASDNYYQQLYKAAPGYNGNYAAKLVTLLQGDTILVPGIMVNAKPAFDFFAFITNFDFNAAISYIGGTPVTQQIGTVSAMVKYSTPLVDVDNGLITVQAIKTMGGVDSVVGSGSSTVEGSTTYVPAVVNVAYTSDTLIPDKILVIFASSDQTSAVDSSTLFVDDVSMSTLSIANTALQGNIVAVYPNPCKDVLHINGPANTPLVCTVLAVSGQVVATKNIHGNTAADFSQLADGIYTYSITNEGGAAVQRGKLTIAH